MKCVAREVVQVNLVHAAAVDDIIKFNEAAATATSSGYLKGLLDELVAEYEVVRSTLEQLYTHMNEEENERLRWEH